MGHRNFVLCSMFLAITLSIGSLVARAAAALDITGTWVIEFRFIAPPQIWTFVQTGNQLTATTIGVQAAYSGTIDPTSGVFHIDLGPSIPQFPGLCPDNSFDGVVASNGDGLTGGTTSYVGAMCRGFADPVTGSRCGANTANPDCIPPVCGNGIVEGIEQCDDGNTVNGDGCDSDCTLPACGNGIVDPGEQCDDGNTRNDDGCDNNCTPTGCGNGITTFGEQCDDGNTVNGDGCDASCLLECQNALTQAEIRFGQLGTLNDTFTLRGTLALPAPFNPPLNPLTNGLRLLIDGATRPVLDITIPGGALPILGHTGWKVNAQGTTWTYVAARADRIDGIFQLVVQDKSKVAPGRVTFVAKGKKAGYTILPTDLPLMGLVLLDFPAGQCGEATFPGPAPMPQCTLSTSGRTLTCK